MKFSRKIGALLMGAALCATPAWSAPTQNGSATKLTQPTPQQMMAIQKMLGVQKPHGKAAKAKPLLPAKFGGWVRGSMHAAKPEAANAAALKEFGLQSGEEADYSRGSDKIDVRVMKFPDATGAYGMFTLLRTAGMETVRVGAHPVKKVENKKPGKKDKKREHTTVPLTSMNGAHEGEHFLFWKGDLLVDARFMQPVADETGVVASLDKVLPQLDGPRGVAPSLPEQLPRKELDASSVQYAIGMAAYKQEGGVLPAEVMDFDTDAEVVTAQYGKGTLTIVSYPTPEIAQAREAAVASVLKSGVVPGPKTAQLVKRAGPLVAMTSGDFTAAEAKALLKRVKFQGTVALDQLKPQESEVAKTAKLLLGIASLTVILGAAAILLGFFLGGGRAMYRVMRGKPASSVTDEEFIALDLNKPIVARSEASREKSANG